MCRGIVNQDLALIIWAGKLFGSLAVVKAACDVGLDMFSF
jgi:hypothetical protein